MSGGHFNYKQFAIEEIADAIDKEIAKYYVDRGDSEPVNGYAPDTIAVFKETSVMLRKLFILVHRIDFLLSSDDSENEFHERIKEDFDEAGF